jgi:hypothetical protein
MRPMRSPSGFRTGSFLMRDAKTLTREPPICDAWANLEHGTW